MSIVTILKKINILFDPLLEIRIIGRNRVLLKQLIIRNIEARYKGSVLGIIWSFIQPLLMLCVYTFVFSVVFTMRLGVEIEYRGAFAIIMLCGMSIYNIFSESVSICCGIIPGNPNYVKKVIFPLEILPLAQVIASFILGMSWFILLFIGVCIVFGRVSLTMLFLPITLLPLLFLTYGLCMLVASLGVYVRDIQYLVGVVLQILFFITPIFYPITAVPEEYRGILQINPLTTIVEETRKIFLMEQLPDWNLLAISFIVSLIIMRFGIVWFIKTKKGFADVL